MKKVLLVLFVLFSLNPVFAQETEAESAAPAKEYSHAQVAATAYWNSYKYYQLVNWNFFE